MAADGWPVNAKNQGIGSHGIDIQGGPKKFLSYLSRAANPYEFFHILTNFKPFYGSTTK